MYTNWLFKNFHSIHHQFNPVSIFTFDRIIGAAISIYGPALIIPVHPTIIILCFWISLYWNFYLYNNNGYMIQSNLFCDNKRHLLHHSTAKFNYGFFFFTHWDKWCGTYKKISE